GERPENAELGESRDQIGRMAVGEVELRGRGDDLLVDELPDREDHLPALDGLIRERGEGADPLAVPLDEIARDDRALDLVRALADDPERRVAVVTLDVQG